MAISWTKLWSASDDGSVLSGADIRNIQDDISESGDAVSLHGFDVEEPTSGDDDAVLFWDDGNQVFDYKPVLDEDTMSSDSATALVTQQSIVAYTGKFKVGLTTRDMTTATGTQAVTGVGFQPKAVILFVSRNSSLEWSFGFADGTTERNVYSKANTGTDQVAVSSASILMDQGTSNTYAGDIDSFDADGFTISWTKTNSPTGTASVAFLAIR
jgi:hypothetical protein